MIVGIDFDNTLVCYDTAFYQTALERGLIPPETAKTKEAVRTFLVDSGKEPDFTLLQGAVYGPGIRNAASYPGALACLRRLTEKGLRIYIVSHKTMFPYLGPRYNLREAATGWLEAHGFLDLLPREAVFFEDTLDAKVARINALQCACFIDDLLKVLQHPQFPAATQPLLFCPTRADHRQNTMGTFPSWSSLQDYLEALL